MKFRIFVPWPSDDILPMAVEFDTASAALSQYRRLANSGVSCVEIHFSDKKGSSRITARRLAALAGTEAFPTKRRKRRLPKAIVGAFLSLVATSLPNSFAENFGAASSNGSLRAARTARSRQTDTSASAFH
jgi:hypothetical protein